MAESPPSPVRRAAVSDTLLAAEKDGEIYLEVMAGKGDSSKGLALKYSGNKAAASLIRAANEGSEPATGKFYRIPFGVLLDEHRRLALAALYPYSPLPSEPYFRGGLGSSYG